MQLSRMEILELRFHTFSRHVLCCFMCLTTDANLLFKISFDYRCLIVQSHTLLLLLLQFWNCDLNILCPISIFFVHWTI